MSRNVMTKGIIIATRYSNGLKKKFGNISTSIIFLIVSCTMKAMSVWAVSFARFKAIRICNET